MYPGGSTVAVDTSSTRNSDRLTAFLSEIMNDEPIDNKFVLLPTLDHLRSKARIKNGGRQIWTPIDSGVNSTVGYYSDYDPFDVSAQSTALSVAYPYINIGASVVISEEELRETAGSDHQVYDLIKHKKNNCLMSVLDQVNADLFAASQVAGKVNTLAVQIDSSGLCGDLNASTDADWAAVENAGGVFTAQGYDDMVTMYNDLKANKSRPSAIITTQTVHELYELELNPDVRYGSAKEAGKRGVLELFFKDVPLLWDDDCTAGVMYFINNNHLYMCIDSAQNFSFDPFAKPVNQKAQVALFSARFNVVCDKRKAQGKITGIS